MVITDGLASAGAGTAWHNREPRTSDVPCIEYAISQFSSAPKLRGQVDDMRNVELLVSSRFYQSQVSRGGPGPIPFRPAECFLCPSSIFHFFQPALARKIWLLLLVVVSLAGWFLRCRGNIRKCRLTIPAEGRFPLRPQGALHVGAKPGRKRVRISPMEGDQDEELPAMVGAPHIRVRSSAPGQIYESSPVVVDSQD